MNLPQPYLVDRSMTKSLCHQWLLLQSAKRLRGKRLLNANHTLS